MIILTQYMSIFKLRTMMLRQQHTVGWI